MTGKNVKEFVGGKDVMPLASGTMGVPLPKKAHQAVDYATDASAVINEFGNSVRGNLEFVDSDKAAEILEELFKEYRGHMPSKAPVR